MTTMQAATIIDGRALAERVREQIAERVRALADAGHRVQLDAILVGANDAARLYADKQAAMCDEVGIRHALHERPADVDPDALDELIDRLNADPDVHAIMVHLPLPAGIDTRRVQSRLAVEKDVEGVNPANIGNVVYGRRSLVPCTSLAVMEMIESTGIELPGAHCVCVGASNIVGKPVAVLLMQAEATVVSTNEHTTDLRSHTRAADVLVVAAGVPGLVTADMVKPGAVVVDVGINRVRGADGKLCTVGDVAFEGVRRVAGAVSPVPGGVGPMTVAMLLRNTVDAAGRAALSAAGSTPDDPRRS